MDIKFEERTNVKFCAKLGKSASETLALLREAYGDETIGPDSVFRVAQALPEGKIIS